MKNKIILISVIFIFILFIGNSVNASNEEVYDVILFWGQSNMVGYCGGYETEKKADSRYNYANSDSVKAFSKSSGIDEEILSKSTTMGHVDVDLEGVPAYEYIYNTNSLKQIKSNTSKLGELLTYTTSGNLRPYNSGNDKYYSLQASSGTNIIPQFCKTYYERTGRGVIAVLCANGGEKIANYLPSNDEDYADENKQMIYEATIEKYRSAIEFLENDGSYKIGKKLYVVFQGETDVSGNTTKANYEKYFMKVHNYLKKDLGITRGAIIETSHKLGYTGDTLTRINENVEIIKSAQDTLIEESDIILGTRFPYLCYKNKKTQCFAQQYTINGELKDNRIHFTSAALSQIRKRNG